MNVTRYSPWSAPAHLGDEMRQVLDRFFGDADSDASKVVTSNWTPRVDIKEEAERFLILADIPGVDPGQIEIDMDNGILSIRGERSETLTSEGERFSRIERSHGVFYRRFALPDSTDPEGIAATGKHGVLEISIPKRAETKPRRIQVKPAASQG